MRHRSVQSRAGSLTAAAVLAVAFGASAAQAGFLLDLQLAGGAKSTTVTPNAAVTLDVWGTVTGADANAANEGLQDVFFGVTNSGGHGDLSIVTLQSPFTGVATNGTGVTTSSGGTLYGPAGSKSVGSTDSASADGWVFARSTAMTQQPSFTNGSSTKLGTLTFTANSTPGTTTLALNARQAVNSLVIPALWQEDGQARDNGSVGGNGTLTLGSAVSITVQPAVTFIPGDADGDGDVDGSDIAIWANHFTGSLAPGAGTSTRADGDFDADGDVDGADAAIWANNFTGSLAPSAALTAVPEPASLGLVGLGAVAALARRRRKA